MSREYPDRPFVGVGVVVWRGDEVLLIQRGKPPRLGAWSLPGGAQELGETVRETAVREVCEEPNIEIEVTRLIDVVDGITRDEDGRVRMHYTLVDFAAEWRAGEPGAGSDAMGAQWIHPDDLGPLRLWKETLRIIEMSAAYRRETA